MSQSDDEALTFIRALLGSAARPDAPDPPDVDPDPPDTDPDLGSFTRRLFNTPTPTKENQ